jgi:hypothetical protein
MALLIWRAGTGSRLRISENSTACVFAANGRRATAISYITTPRA